MVVKSWIRSADDSSTRPALNRPAGRTWAESDRSRSCRANQGEYNWTVMRSDPSVITRDGHVAFSRPLGAVYLEGGSDSGPQPLTPGGGRQEIRRLWREYRQVVTPQPGHMISRTPGCQSPVFARSRPPISASRRESRRSHGQLSRLTVKWCSTFLCMVSRGRALVEKWI